MVHDHVHNSPPLVPTLSQMTPVHIFSSCFYKTQSNTFHLHLGLPQVMTISIRKLPKSLFTFIPFQHCITYAVEKTSLNN